GDFTSISGQPRNHVARIDVPSFTLAAWNPGANNNVMALLATGSTVYTAGQFTQLGTRARNHVGAIDATTGAVRGFDPNTSGIVWSIARQSGVLYLGGDLGTVGGQPRSNVAAVDSSTGAVLPFDAHVHAGIGLIRSLVATPDALYIGGSFIDTIGGEPGKRGGAVDPDTGALLPWNLHASDDVYAIAVDPKGIIVGGTFTSVNGQDRANLAAIDLTTGRATSWKPTTTLDPNQGNRVSALAFAGSTIYIGGIFAAINGQPRANFAAVSTAGTVLPIRADANGQITTLATSGSNVYIGGLFTTIAGTSRNHLAEIDSTGTMLPWNPNANDTIQSLAVAGSSIYAAGVFSTIGGQSRHGLVALDPTTGAPGPDFQTDGFSHALAYDGVTLYIGGQFTSFGGQPRTDLAAIIPGTTTPTSFAPVEPPASQADAIGVTSSTVYAAVSYAPNSTALFDKTSGAPVTANTALPTTFFTFVRVPNGIAFGGTFASVGTSPQSGIAVFTGTP
ncbi:MAG TPA: hypothetical protein VGO00_03950, partial [Kofleriaceae bacterium]|nr:hypothetical protein [Kofleriaceae bacterium]